MPPRRSEPRPVVVASRPDVASDAVKFTSADGLVSMQTLVSGRDLAPIVRQLARTRDIQIADISGYLFFFLTRDRLEESAHGDREYRAVFRSDIARLFRICGQKWRAIDGIWDCDVVSSGVVKGIWLAGVVDDGTLHIGCKQFDSCMTVIIRAWALAAPRKLAEALSITIRQAVGLFLHWENDGHLCRGRRYCWPRKYRNAYKRADTVAGKAAVAVRLLKEIAEKGGDVLLNPDYRRDA